MRRIAYTDGPLEGGRAYIECQVRDSLIFIVDSTAEAQLEPWAREKMWNDIFQIAENPPTSIRVRQEGAEIIDIIDLRARRQYSVRQVQHS